MKHNLDTTLLWTIHFLSFTDLYTHTDITAANSGQYIDLANLLIWLQYIPRDSWK